MTILACPKFQVLRYNEFDLQSIYTSYNEGAEKVSRFAPSSPSTPPPTTFYTYLVTVPENPAVTLERYNEAISSNPANAFARYNRATLLHEHFGTYEEAQSEMDIALRLEPSLILALESQNKRRANEKGLKDLAAPLVLFENPKSNFVWLDHALHFYLLAMESDLKSLNL